ncbi:tripeptidyl-peptidase B, Serine peptidase, MEROPS family S33 [Streptoalloteichus tenebrarius]|uniref:Tripeptidyl-peptidase B, Serine peptidase, MEROPS family S33 n=1 Tax=Streptoalloteichus tenebrarius (strain ATCC 17920 / DSM 40477 / JCM 4838 / CBS 697.72 / NBRC 16177 / NCIMB 11028 / NRRL B-12390 / A12253. 1 / ISP 5477) TaxID=1933 RepID=A0ABT1HVW3_STRSD|nr:alpha/beta hydrolase [Streptoalloteichus tenebrarius]MCP2259668.1 tripeptidyl-peptidase B, Serine peptidase, MEROPS family S33 [Streptoalloteichus tenebrarius]BFF00645.1 alpha/beta hydrolase [Streptoalloteichus tenebrarius]
MSRLSRLVVALGAAALLTACSSAVDGTPTPPKLEQRGPVNPVPAGLERFYGQPVGWTSCQGFASTPEQRSLYRKRGIECARVTVPLDYAKPDGETVSLALLRRPASNPDRRVGSLLINPGGPGGSGVEAAASLASRVDDGELGQRFDLVGFDPRGVGASEPQVRCLTDQERDAERLDLDLDTSPQGVEQTENEEKEYAQKCAERVGKDLLAHVGTRDVVRDMDVLRSVLGDAKLTYVGFSYGTRIGTAYAEAFPTNVRAMVLDGAVAPTEDRIAQSIGQAKGFADAFAAFASWCARRPDCALGGDAEAAEKKLDEMVAPMKKEPLAVEDRKLSYTDVGTAVAQAMYSKELWPVLNTGLTELAHGKGRALLMLADAYLGRGSDGRYSTQTDAFRAIRCVDDPPVTDRAVLLETARKVREAVGEHGVLDDGAEPVGVLDACAFWPVPPTSQPHQPKVDGLPQTLVISTTGDPATPYQAGVDLAKALNARLLTFTGNQHTAFLQNNRCVDTATTRYLVDLTPPAEGARC